MKQQFKLFKRDGYFYSEDTTTGNQKSLRTKSKSEAVVLLNAKNESARQPSLNLQLARTYHRVAHPSVVNEPVDNVVWWNFSEPLPPARLPWTTQELEQLRAQASGALPAGYANLLADIKNR